jgi:adenylate cyclase
MSGEKFQSSGLETRKLAAIMFTDMVDFSRKMGVDEPRTLRLLEVHNRVIRQAVMEQQGVVIKTIGDAFLVDFPSVVNAVHCAQQIQAQFHAHNAAQEKTDQIHVRIGIHLGEVVHHDGEVFGDGVDIASHLQALAEPDTICISDIVYQDVSTKIDLGEVVSLGRPKLKNIAEQFQVYALFSAPPTDWQYKLQVQRLRCSRRVRSASLAAVASVLLLLIGRLVMPELFSFPVWPGLPFPEKPSIVVLSFANLSDDPRQGYFSNGITKDITANLSQISSLFVLSHHTAITVSREKSAKEISNEFGVQYVLEGSVLKVDGRVQLTVQLTDVTQNRHL